MPNGAETEKRYLLGVDGGQTGTRALLARVSGEVIGRGSGGPIDHFHTPAGFEKNHAALGSAIGQAVANAGLGPDMVVTAALGLTGVQMDVPEAPEVESIVRGLIRADQIQVVPDYVSNLAGASGGKHGIVVIAGGGAVAYGVTEDGRQALSGGFGYLLGDEGSGFDIGQQATVAGIRASDGRGEPTVLEAAVRVAFGLTDMRQIFALVYEAGFGRERLAELTPLVVHAAEAGDAAAAHILRSAGQELANMALAVMRKLYTNVQEPILFLSGGVFNAGNVIREPFREAIKQHWGTAEIRSAANPPVVGALILACKRASAVGMAPSPDAAWLQAVHENSVALAGLCPA